MVHLFVDPTILENVPCKWTQHWFYFMRNRFIRNYSLYSGKTLETYNSITKPGQPNWPRPFWKENANVYSGTLE